MPPAQSTLITYAVFNHNLPAQRILKLLSQESIGITMKTAVIIYPHQLYHPHPLIAPDRHHILVEEPLFFGDTIYPAKFHKLKLMMHRATMKRYQADHLDGYSTNYIDYHSITHRDSIFKKLSDDGFTSLHIIDPTDEILTRRIHKYSAQYNLDLTLHNSPNFVTTPAQIEDYFAHNKYFQTDFYIWQRKRLHILLENDNRPVGGKWTYDSDNRKKLPKAVTLPSHPKTTHNPYITEARAYIEANFPDNYGKTDNFIYPTSHAEAQQALQQFLHIKVNNYGPYQDAITTRGDFLFHSLLSAPLNIGLLSPQHIIDATLDYYHDHITTVTLTSVEGFIRQIIGWREFMRAVYLRDGATQRTRNFFDHHRTLSSAWYKGTTGIPPIDDTIHKLNTHAYAHHIERLMILGNMMTLCEIHPDEVYRWFMEMFIDSYDWVMVPNVYGMSLYADGGMITTKPYISSSNYIRKMSDYKKAAWMDTWDGLYWRFIHKHRDFFGGNARLAMMTSHLKRMPADKLQAHINNAEAFLTTL